MDRSATKDRSADAMALVGSLMDLLPLLRGALQAALHAQDVTTWEAAILMLVDRHGRVRLSEVSRRVGMPPSTLTGVVDRLERAGLVRRLRDAADRRGVLVEGTEQLARWAGAVQEDLQRRITPLLVDLPPDLVPRLTADMALLASALRARGGEHHSGGCDLDVS